MKKCLVTVIGGGTGSFNLLSGLKNYKRLCVYSIVTMMDSGGDSGQLRDEFGVLPPGDARSCLVALSEETQLLRNLFNYRFANHPLEGRNMGNLLLLALTKMLGTEQKAITAISRLLKIRGKVIAVTENHSHLFAELADGTIIAGEANIDVPKHNPNTPIKRVFLKPDAAANPEAVDAIERADFIVLGPGDLFTSTIPNLLVKEIPDAIRQSPAPLIYVLNLMTKHGETDGYTAARHVHEIVHYGGRVPDAVLVHRGKVPADLAVTYEAEKAHPVLFDVEELLKLGVRRVKISNVMSKKSLVRHDPIRTAKALTGLFKELSGDAEN